MKKIEVAFVDVDIKRAFEELKEGKFEDEKIYNFILRAIDDLKENPHCGIRVPRKLIPKEYIKKYSVRNIWKH